MKKIIFLILIVSFLSGCSVDWNGEKDRKITELEKQIEELQKNNFDEKNISNTLDYDFNKKNDCAKSRKDIEKIEDIGYHFDEKEKTVQDNQIEQIFYSPVYNSCLYGVKYNYIFSDSENKRNSWNTYIIKDFLTSEIIYTSEIVRLNEDGLNYLYKKEEEFKNKIKELKGE